MTTSWEKKRKRVMSVLQFWKSFVVVLTPLVTLPIAFQGDIGDTRQAFKCAYVMILMAVFWTTEALPLAVTALIPVVLFPILGIMTTDEVGKEYMKETNLMFMSGIMVAIAVEHCNLHTRIALKVLLFIGTGPRRLMLGFMIVTGFFSMWMSNTATTAMMVPIVTGVVNELDSGIDDDNSEVEDTKGVQESEIELSSATAEDRSGDEVEGKNKGRAEWLRRRRIMMFLSVAYAANTGGTATLTGTGTNLILKGILSSSFEETPINFASWLGFALPIALICIAISWIWLQCWFLGFRDTLARCGRRKGKDEDGAKAKDRHRRVKRVLLDKYDKLGPMSFHEVCVFILFLGLVFLWFFRDPGFMKGWGNYVTKKQEVFKPLNQSCVQEDCVFVKEFTQKETIDDATAGMLIVLILFILPSTLTFWPFTTFSNPPVAAKPSESLLNWKVINTRMPWGLVLLLGGGFAIAKATQISGFSQLLSQELKILEFMDPRLLVIIICVFTAAATEVTSNVATISIILPILRDLSLSLRINPLYLMLPTTISCSYAFMLPVATPPNAIVFATSGVMKTIDMIKCGFFMNVICIGVALTCINTYAVPMFDLNHFPDWANSTSSTPSQ